MSNQFDHVIDGSLGEGGGQILRTSLSLAMCTGQSVVIDNIRAGRAKPGLLRQHLTAVRAAAQVSCAQVSGDELRSTRVEFRPGAIRGGTFRFSIGTAGSTTLLWQTILPALLMADQPSELVLEGGTHNGMAPSVDFIEQCFLPAVARMGISVSSDLRRHGFFPNGGGEWHVRVEPWKERQPYVVTQRGAPLSRAAVAKIARIKGDVAQRELARVANKLRWGGSELQALSVDSPGPGNILSLRVGFEHVTEVFEALGERGTSAERVADKALRALSRYLVSDQPVGEYLADQLLLPMVLGVGGEFRTGALSEHTRTNIKVIEQLLGKPCFEVESPSDDGLASTQGPGNVVRVCRNAALFDGVL